MPGESCAELAPLALNAGASSAQSSPPAPFPFDRIHATGDPFCRISGGGAQGFGRLAGLAVVQPQSLNHRLAGTPGQWVTLDIAAVDRGQEMQLHIYGRAAQ